MATRCVTFLSDFGAIDTYVAEVKAVWLRKAPRCAVVDLTHQIPAFDVAQGAFHLRRAYYHFPKGSLHLAIVDPGVGSARAPIVVKTKFHTFVGPDNGLLKWAVDDALTRYGGERVIYEIPEPNDIAPTFHGRDVFAPFIAKWLAGKRIRMKKKKEILGEPFPSAPQIVAFDHYGNAVTSIPRETKLSAIVVDSAGLTAQAKAYYQEIQENEIAAIQGSHGFWELCCNQASARQAFKLTRGLNLTVKTST